MCLLGQQQQESSRRLGVLGGCWWGSAHHVLGVATHNAICSNSSSRGRHTLIEWQQRLVLVPAEVWHRITPHVCESTSSCSTSRAEGAQQRGGKACWTDSSWLLSG